RGQFVCPRQGAAVDFVVEDEDMSEVVKWTSDTLNFDRIYYYGHARPIHVSFSERPAHEITELRQAKDGKLIPKKFVI
ncbi:MAG: hypothetical protein WCB20_02285, partial [Chthoniobacterales bacterium]